MRSVIKKAAGAAIGNMRFDGIRVQDVGKGRPQAQKARERLIDGEVIGEAIADQQKRIEDKYGAGCSLTDAIVKDLGGSRAAEYQAKEYQALLDRIKDGNLEKVGSPAEAARQRMIDRQCGNDDTENGGHPDIGKDMANRRAYPKGSRSRRDAADETSGSSREEARERAKVWANAGSM